MAIHFTEAKTKTVPEMAPKIAGQRIIKAAKEALPMVKRGPKPSGMAKQLLTLRLDQDVIAGYRAKGEGWQAMINAALRRTLNL